MAKPKHTRDEDYEYTVMPNVPPTQAIEHTPDRPFCNDPSCPCHEDPEAIGMVNQYYQDGLITADDATRTIKGKQI